MKLVISGFPTSALNICAVDENQPDAPLKRDVVWYDNFIPACGRMYEDFPIEETLFFGPADYTLGLAEQLKEVFGNDLNIVIVTHEEDITI